MADEYGTRLENRRALEGRAMEMAPRPSSGGPANLADILERVLDKGIVIAGDIQVNLLDIELLTIKLRLLVASVERAQEMGINWWEADPTLSANARELEQENKDLRERLDRLEDLIAGALPPGQELVEEHREEHEEVLDRKGDVIDERHEHHDDVRVEPADDEPRR